MPPLTGVLVADFSDFQQAVSESVIKLRSFEEGASKVGTSLNRMADQFSGRKVITDATQMAEVFDRMGGAAAFTEKELARMGATGTEAVAKLKALGQDVPPGIQAIAEQTKKVETAQTDLIGSLKNVAVAFGLAFSIDKLAGMISGIIEMGGRLTDLAARTGITTTALQQLEFAGGQVGVSLDKIVGAVGQIQNRMASGDSSFLAAIDRVGIKLAELKAQTPEEQFKTIANALGEVTNQAEFVALGMDMMGKGFLEVAPLISADLQDLIDKSKELGVVLDEQTIANLDDMGDSLDQLTAAGTAVIANALAPMLPLLTQLAQGALGFGTAMTNAQRAFEQLLSIVAGKLATIGELEIRILKATNAFGVNNALIATFTELVAQAREVAKQLATEALPPMTEAIIDNTEMFGPWETAAQQAAREHQLLGAELALLEPKVGSLSEFMKRAKTDTDEWGKRLRFTSTVVDELPAKLDKASSALKNMTKAPEEETAGAGAGAPGTRPPAGAVPFDTSGMTIPNLAELWKQYNAAFFSASAGHMGPPVPDVLSWGLDRNLVQRDQAPQVTNNINLTGLLGTNDPQTRQIIRDLVGEAFTEAMRGQRLMGTA